MVRREIATVLDMSWRQGKSGPILGKKRGEDEGALQWRVE